MTILHLTTFLQGGAGRMVVSLAIDQHRDGHAVTVVTSRTGQHGYGNYVAYIEQLTRAGVSVHLADSTFARDHASNLAVARLLDAIYPAGEEPDVIHTHAAIPSLVALTFAGSRSRRIPVVQTMHGWGVAKTADQAVTDVTILNLVHGVAVPSEHARWLLTSLGVTDTRITVVPYGIRERICDLYARDRALLDEMAIARDAGRLVVAAVGTIGARKNQRAIVDALYSRSPGALAPGATLTASVFCVFIGDGDSSELSAVIRDAGLSDRCRVHGYSSAARRLAAAADLLVLPSRSEGQPISVLEAFADGTLVAVSDIPELVELVDDGVTGVVFRVDDVVSLGDALVRVARMPAAERDAIRKRARERYASSFTAAAMAERYADLYRQLIATKTVGEPENAVA